MGTHSIEFVLNGQSIRAEGLAPHTTLLDFLRSRGLTGAKEGCAEGECGACTVAFVRGTPAAYVPVNSCLVLLPMAAGQEIYTVEALAADGQLHEVQKAMVACGGSQCGYCTPGFVVSLFAEQYRPGRDGSCDVHSMSGNLCRCTGYRPIRDAAASLGPAPQDAFQARLSRAAPTLGAMDSDGFSRPATLAECLSLMTRYPSARLIAGGTDLVVESNLKLRRFDRLISVEAIPELRVQRQSAHEIEIGAALTLSEIEPPHAVWNEWLDLFASPLIRNRATLGGNLATASPIGDGAPLLLALDAAVRIAGPSGERRVPLSEFFVAYRKTALQPGEMLVSVILPKPLPSVVRFYKAAKRRMDDISTVAACFALDALPDGRIERARLAYGGVAATPVRVPEAEEALTGSLWNESALERARAILGRTLRPISDHRGSAAYRLELSRNLLHKFWLTLPESVAA